MNLLRCLQMRQTNILIPNPSRPLRGEGLRPVNILLPLDFAPIGRPLDGVEGSVTIRYHMKIIYIQPVYYIIFNILTLYLLLLCAALI